MDSEKRKYPKIQIRLTPEQSVARDYLQDICCIDVNLAIRQFLMKLYTEEKTRRQPA